MARQVPVEIAGGAYQDDTRPFDQQDCVNFIPERDESGSARSAGVLLGAPGLRQMVIFVPAETTFAPEAADISFSFVSGSLT